MTRLRRRRRADDGGGGGEGPTHLGDGIREAADRGAPGTTASPPALSRGLDEARTRRDEHKREYMRSRSTKPPCDQLVALAAARTAPPQGDSTARAEEAEHAEHLANVMAAIVRVMSVLESGHRCIRALR